MEVRVEEIIEEKVELPELPSVKELPRRKPRDGRLARASVLGLITALKQSLNQEPAVIEATVLAGIAGLPALLLGPHGSGKTTLVKALARCLTIDGRPAKFQYINVKEGHTEFTVMARPNYAALMQGREEWVPKAVAADIPFFDEVFRNPRVFAAFNEALEEGTFEGLRVNWKMVFAATNPPSEWYKTVSMLNWADLDRFAVHVVVTDGDFGWADALAFGPPEPPEVRVDIANIGDVRREIAATKVSPEALTLAKVIVGAFSACRYTPLNGGSSVRTFNKFEFDTLPCYNCRYQRHPLCPRYALAPKRALRSLLGLARARAWVLGRSVSTEDVWWSFPFTVPGRAAVLSPELREKLPTVRGKALAMERDFRSWYESARRRLESPYPPSGDDPVLSEVYAMIKPITVLRGYRLHFGAELLPRFLKYWVVKGAITAERAASAMQALEQGFAANVAGYRVSKDPYGYAVLLPPDEKLVEEVRRWLEEA